MCWSQAEGNQIYYVIWVTLPLPGMKNYTKHLLVTFVGINWENTPGNDRKDFIIWVLAPGTKLVSMLGDKILKVHCLRKYLNVFF